MSWPLAPTSSHRELRAGEPCGQSLGLGLCRSGAVGGVKGQWMDLSPALQARTLEAGFEACVSFWKYLARFAVSLQGGGAYRCVMR